MFFTDFLLLECSNDFKRIHANLGMCGYIVWERSKVCWPSATQLSIKNSSRSSLTKWSIPLTTLSISTSTPNFNVQKSNKETILSHGMLEVVATRHRLQRLWGRIVISIFFLKSNQIDTNFWQSKPPRQMKIFNFKNFPQ